MNRTRSKPPPARILAGQITAEEAAREAGLTLPEVIRLYRKRKIFGLYGGGTLYLSPAVLGELRELADSLQHRPPHRPEILAGGRV